MSNNSKYNYWIHSGKYTSIQKLSTLLMGIFSFMILARTLGPGGFGVWGLFMTISSITEIARSSLIRNAFIRFINQTPESEHPILQAAAYAISLSLSLFVAVIFFILSHPVSIWLNAPELEVMLKWYCLSILVSTVFAHCEMLLNAVLDFRGVCYIYCIRQGLLLAAIGFCFSFKINISPTLLSIFYLSTLIISGISGIKFSVKYLKFNFSNSKIWMRKLWSFGKYVFGTNASAQLFRSTDNFITANVFTPSITAYYNACLRIGNLADMPSQVLGDVLFPKVAKYNASEKNAIANMYEKTVGATLTFSIPALLILLLFPSLILQILAGKDFVQAASVLRVTAFFGFALPFIKQFGTIMDATGHPDLNFKTTLLAFIINIGTNLLGVHFFGIIGAAFGTATTYTILLFVSHAILHKKFGVKWSRIFQNTFSFYPEFFKLIKLKLKFA